ncbi:sulfatase-like hydrolase/transferase [candidate division KSB1 bacterium]|nr:sulfatase-like hydrolase/transferase [candidate division KSB1 bacterium]
MNRRRFLHTFGVGTLPLLTMSLYSCNTERKKPNIILILADDQGWSQLGCYGSDYYQTPNIDKLAEQGMRFTDAYAAAPVCSPTRASIQTGKYPARLHLTEFIAGFDIPMDKPLIEPDWHKVLPLEETTIAEALKQKGYTTAHIGKWHLSQAKTPPESLPCNPDKQGYDETFVTYKPGRGMAREWQTPENDGHNVKIITEKSLDFIEENKDRPFFLQMSHNSVHGPLMEKQALIEKYKDHPGADEDKNHPVTAAMTETLDHSVGQVMNKLDELGLAENTLLIYYSDNGNKESTVDQDPLRAGKGLLYEGGIRVPFIVRWPGHTPPGSVNHEPISSVDFLPTFLDILNLNLKRTNIDGKSILALFEGESSIGREAIYWHYPHYHRFAFPGGAIRQGKYKLIERYDKSLWNQPGAFELYDLEKDIGEQNNLATQMPKKTKELAEKLAAWRQLVGAQMPTKNPNYIP